MDDGKKDVDGFTNDPRFQAMLARARESARRSVPAPDVNSAPTVVPPDLRRSTQSEISQFVEHLQMMKSVTFLMDPGACEACAISGHWDNALRVYFHFSMGDCDDLANMLSRARMPMQTPGELCAARDEVQRRINNLKELSGASFAILWHVQGEANPRFDFAGQDEDEAFEALRRSFASEMHDAIMFG